MNKNKLYIFFLALCLVGCAKKQPEKLPMKELHSEADLTGLRVGVSTGSTYDLHLSSRKDITEMGYNSISDALLALTQGKLDVFVEDESSIPRDEQKRLGITIAFYGDEAIPCAFPMHKGDDGLRDSLSHFIDSLNATGEMQEIHDRWFLSDNPSQMRIPDLGPEPTGKPILVGSAIEMPPVAFHVSSVWQGFEPEVLQRFSRYVGRPLKFDYYPLSSAISAIQSNKIHVIVGGIFITEERQKTMDFSSSHFSVRAAYYVKDENAQTASFGDKLKNMVYNNLVVENRWKYITDGLWETVKISLFSLLLGTLFGAGICALRMSRSKGLSRIAKIYIDIMRGIPMLVFLMIMFYVIFAKTGLGGTAIAVLAFAMNFAAYVSEMFRTAIQSVGKGQVEAGLALGLTKWQTFWHITAPQAVKNVMPVYKGEAVSLVKNTSIVGYIAIQDLTRASDIIRTRTFDAFFPLLIVTIIYFILAWLLGKALDLIVKPQKTTKNDHHKPFDKDLLRSRRFYTSGIERR
ncbi:MAG: ABC transporter permease subunit [Bacteroidales bacterium]|nr:ABC transporter permease subunit [Bacteroidales bacterium]